MSKIRVLGTDMFLWNKCNDLINYEGGQLKNKQYYITKGKLKCMNQTPQTLDLLDILTKTIKKNELALGEPAGCTHTMGQTTFSRSH